MREKFEGGGGVMPERVKKMKCGGWRVKLWGGGLDHTKNLGESVENYVFFRGGCQILNGIAQCK